MPRVALEPKDKRTFIDKILDGDLPLPNQLNLTRGKSMLVMQMIQAKMSANPQETFVWFDAEGRHEHGPSST